MIISKNSEADEVSMIFDDDSSYSNREYFSIPNLYEQYND